jgi:D-beta-D-heptose 7-phosphate kinase / D-beta-D-heptose 1-phosphate adenosyltransferase
MFEQSDLLVVGVNSDQSVRTLKGPGRPIYDEQTRMSLLANLLDVDYVIKRASKIISGTNPGPVAASGGEVSNNYGLTS